jgi:hypothetical protein
MMIFISDCYIALFDLEIIPINWLVIILASL